MATGARPSRGGSIRSRRHLRQSGVVVQAVLLTVLVMMISLLTVVSRVAGSRDAAAASSLVAAARQAAEFGFSETVAEMNRDSKSYLWITPFSSWSSVSQQALQDCGIYAPTAPVNNPIEGVASSKSLPNAPALAYRLADFTPPTGSSSCPAGYGNRSGGSATLTVVGTAMSGTGSSTTFTLRRNISVGPAVSPFQRSILAARAVLPTDRRFPAFPTPSGSAPAGLGVPAASVPAKSSWPDVACQGTGASAYSCTLVADGVSRTESFSNAAQFKFPYTTSGSALLNACSTGANQQVVCMFKSLTVTNNLDLIVTAPPALPVSIFVDDGTLQVDSGSKVCSHASAAAAATSVTTCTAASGDWQTLRFFGKASGVCTGQTVQLNSSSPVGGQRKVNLQNAFLWFPAAQLSVSGNVSSDSADLPGWICAFADETTQITSLADQRASPDRIFGAVIYRGFGSVEVQS